MDATVVVAADGTERWRNDQADRLLGERPLGHALTQESHHKLLATLAAPRSGIELVTEEGLTLDVTATPMAAGIALAVRDVSRYATAAAKLAVVTTQLSRRNRDLQTLYEVAAQLGSTLNLAELRSATCQLVGEYLGADAVATEVGGLCHYWPGTVPDAPADGSLVLDTVTGEVGRISWWRNAPLESAERRLVSLVAGRAAVGFDNATLHATAQHKADHDALTGLLNRAGALRLVPTIAFPATVTLIDLDHFKRVNDEHGHEQGDRVLSRFARALAGGRSTDIAVRWGGEEFLLLHPGTRLAGAEQAVAQLRERVRAAVHVAGRPLTFSAGVAPLDGEGGLEAAMAAADAALYAAKRSGRDRTVRAGDGPGPSTV